MKSHKWKILGILLIAHLLAYGMGLSILIMLFLPLIGWAINGVLHFPVSIPEIFRLVWLILGMTVATTLVMWLAGIWKGRW